MVGALLGHARWSLLVHDLLNAEGKRVCKVHVSGLLEATFTHKAIDTVTRTSDVGNAVVKVESTTTVGFLLVKQLQSVITDEDADATALTLVRGNGLLQRLNGGADNLVKRFLLISSLAWSTYFVDW